VVLGRPTVEQENTLVYVHEHPASIHGQNYTSHNSVVILLRRGAVYAIAAHKYKIWGWEPVRWLTSRCSGRTPALSGPRDLMPRRRGLRPHLLAAVLRSRRPFGVRRW